MGSRSEVVYKGGDERSFNVKEGDTCSIQGTDPETKRPMMFEGEILGVFGE